jgi:hypothetical protein
MTGEIARLIQPKTFEEAKTIATYLAESDLVPKAFQKKPANILLAWELGADVGLSPMQALQSIAVINGKPSLYGEVGLGIVLASGLMEGLPIEEDDGETATCTVKRKGSPPITRTFSMTEARNAVMWERDANGNAKPMALSERATWKSWPKRMRQMRARWWSLKDAFADVLKGLAIVEIERDLGDVDGHLASDVIETSKVGEEWMPERVAPASTNGEGEGAATATSVAPGATATSVAAPHPRSVETILAPVLDAKVEQEEKKAAAPKVAELLQLVSEKVAERHAPKVEEPAKPAKVEEPKTTSGQVTFTINNVAYTTAGLTREQFLDAADLVVKLDKKCGRGFAKRLLGKVLNVAVSDPLCHRTSLTQATGALWLSQMEDALNPPAS